MVCGGVRGERQRHGGRGPERQGHASAASTTLTNNDGPIISCLGKVLYSVNNKSIVNKLDRSLTQPNNETIKDE